MSRPRMLRRAVPIAVLATVLALVVALPALAGPGGASKWKVWTYNASGRAFSGSVPDNSTGVASFAFPATPDTALLVTDHGSYKGTLLGDLTGETVSATWSDTGGVFTYYGEPDVCGAPASVRVFFSATGGPFAETQYWWAHGSGAAALASGGGPLTASLGNPSQWSDFFGHSGADPAYAAAYADAVANVTSIGLSFGGGCFFENGVGAPAGGSFTLGSFGVS